MKSQKLFPILLITVLFFGCDDFLDCVAGRNPSLPDKTFPIASTSTYYYVDISAEIKNEPRDNNYDYFFEINEADLPEGVGYFINNRIISFEGLPVETGTFEIEVYLYVEGPVNVEYDDDGDAYYTDTLCNHSTQKTYTLIVQ
ncbi:hypothetical protein [Winogradskyella sp. MIT101101]|uniref:hypothetical protein n=1 Tax=Winogradskyella sp. MIT101101 TaxID=3098297 RepID=UPI00399A0037